MQRIVEENISTLFNLKLVKNEFNIGEYRFDSIEYNEETNTFVILEYKRGKNENVINQGYAYLTTLIDMSTG